MSPAAPRTLAQILTTALLLLLLVPLLGVDGCGTPVPAGYALVQIEAGPDFEFDLREALLTAKPGTVIELPAGSYTIQDALSLETPHVILRGQGMHQTVLDFEAQEAAQGILASANDIAFEHFALLNTEGDGIKVENSDGVTFRGVRVEWTRGPDSDNGAYGLYPVGCTNVLIEDSVVKAASDAGIYVGQSSQIVVRRNLVEYNVAGIEIENSTFADVYQNTAIRNAGGILVFDLPGLSMQGGRVRVFQNKISRNNTANFAPEGNIVALVPSGTGMLVMANDDIEVFRNVMKANDSYNIAVASYLVTQLPFDPKSYDPWPERVHIHDNLVGEAGANPTGELGDLLKNLFGVPVPDIVWDGFTNPELVDKEGRLPPDLRLCVQNRWPFSFGALTTLPPIRDPAAWDCLHESLSEVALDAPGPIPKPDDPYTPEEIDALCSAEGEGINRAALVVDCDELSDYRLFEGGDPTGTPAEDGLPFDLTTPLFSDYAAKYRVLFLPPGEMATYDADDGLGFPVGSVIAKTFTFPADQRMPELAEDLVETRLLIHREAGWVGLPYIWNEAETQAFLEIGGGAADVSWIDLQGEQRSTRYQIPNVNQCKRCHEGGSRGTTPIGPKARLLNRPYPYAAEQGGAQNQLAFWAANGYLAGAPAPEAAPRLPVWDDPKDGTLEERTRAYLETNCAHCHRDGGRASTSGLKLEWDRPLGSSYGICKSPISAGPGTGGFLFDILPGSSAESVLSFRMDSAAPSIRMPEVAKSIVHDEGVALVNEWIDSLEGSCK